MSNIQKLTNTKLDTLNSNINLLVARHQGGNHSVKILANDNSDGSGNSKHLTVNSAGHLNVNIDSSENISTETKQDFIISNIAVSNTHLNSLNGKTSTENKQDFIISNIAVSNTHLNSLNGKTSTENKQDNIITKLTDLDTKIGVDSSSSPLSLTALTRVQKDIIDNRLGSIVTFLDKDSGNNYHNKRLEDKLDDSHVHHTTNATKLTSIDTKISDTNSKLTSIETDIEATNTLLTSTNTKLGTIETDIEATNTKLGTIETDIEATNTLLTSTNTKLGTIETDIEATNTKLGTIETDIEASNTLLTSIEDSNKNKRDLTTISSTALNAVTTTSSVDINGYKGIHWRFVSLVTSGSSLVLQGSHDNTNFRDDGTITGEFIEKFQATYRYYRVLNADLSGVTFAKIEVTKLNL